MVVVEFSYNCVCGKSNTTEHALMELSQPCKLLQSTKLNKCGPGGIVLTMKAVYQAVTSICTAGINLGKQIPYGCTSGVGVILELWVL